MKLNVYDFDNTIYNGDSSFDFFRFCLKRHKKIIKRLPAILFYFILYYMKRVKKEILKEVFFSFLKDIENPDREVALFWSINKQKVKGWYLAQRKSTDVIVTASPYFLIKPICEQLEINHLLASEVDINSGSYSGNNCYGEEKVKRYNILYSDVAIENMYTDSLSDLPMLNAAEHGFIVEKENIIPLEDYRLPLKKKLFQQVTDIKFLKFILVGAINSINGVLFSTLFSFKLDASFAFILGYICSLTISYFLNSRITFKDKDFTIKKYITFCISYIPNFLIQLICVYVIADILGFMPMIAYIVSAIVGIPVTYLILCLFTFRK